MLNKKTIQVLFKKLGWFEIFLIVFFVSTMIVISFIMMRQTKWLTVDIKITSDNVLGDQPNPPFWLIKTLNKGDKELSGLGQTNVEVIDLKIYETSDSHKEVYVKAKLKVIYNTFQQKYTFSSKDLLVGVPISVKPRGVLIEGVVTQIEELSSETKFVHKKVLAQIEGGGDRTQTVGIRPWIADTFQIGDKIKDFNGKTIAEVLDKRTEPAVRVTEDDNGNAHLVRDPYLVDLYLELDLLVTQDYGVYYFRDDEKVKVNTSIPLFTPKIDAKATIIKIFD